MSAETLAPTTQAAEILNVTLKFPDVNTFAERFANFLERTRILLPGVAPRPFGTRVRFQLKLKDGTLLIGGAGHVEAAVTQGQIAGCPPGMILAFEPDEASRPLCDRILGSRADARSPMLPSPVEVPAETPAPAEPLPVEAVRPSTEPSKPVVEPARPAVEAPRPAAVEPSKPVEVSKPVEPLRPAAAAILPPRPAASQSAAGGLGAKLLFGARPSGEPAAKGSGATGIAPGEKPAVAPLGKPSLGLPPIGPSKTALGGGALFKPKTSPLAPLPPLFAKKDPAKAEPPATEPSKADAPSDAAADAASGARAGDAQEAANPVAVDPARQPEPAKTPSLFAGRSLTPLGRPGVLGPKPAGVAPGAPKPPAAAAAPAGGAIRGGLPGTASPTRPGVSRTATPIFVVGVIGPRKPEPPALKPAPPAPEPEPDFDEDYEPPTGMKSRHEAVMPSVEPRPAGDDDDIPTSTRPRPTPTDTEAISSSFLVEELDGAPGRDQGSPGRDVEARPGRSQEEDSPPPFRIGGTAEAGSSGEEGLFGGASEETTVHSADAGDAPSLFAAALLASERSETSSEDPEAVRPPPPTPASVPAATRTPPPLPGVLSGSSDSSILPSLKTELLEAIDDPTPLPSVVVAPELPEPPSLPPTPPSIEPIPLPVKRPGATEAASAASALSRSPVAVEAIAEPVPAAGPHPWSVALVSFIVLAVAAALGVMLGAYLP